MARILAPDHKRGKIHSVKFVGKMQKMTASPRDEHRSKTCQIPIRISSKKYSNEFIVSTRRQRLNHFRRMLITRSEEGYVERNPET